MSGTERAPAAPLTEAVFHILLVLADGAQHGYGLMREVDLLTAGAFRLGPGTLYRSLDVLSQDGLIEELAGPQPDERRRVYALTPLGREALRAEALRLEQLVKVARRRGLLTSSRRQADGRAR